MHRYRVILGEHVGDGASQSPNDGMFLHRDNLPGSLSRLYQKLFIDRLDCMDIDYTGADSVTLQSPAASRHAGTHRPVDTMVKSVPSRSVIPFPSSKW